MQQKPREWKNWHITTLCFLLWCVCLFFLGGSAASYGGGNIDPGIGGDAPNGLVGLVEKGGSITLLVIILWLLLAKGLPSILKAHEKNVVLIMDYHKEQLADLRKDHAERIELEDRRHTDNKEALAKLGYAVIDLGIAIDQRKPAATAVVARLNKG